MGDWSPLESQIQVKPTQIPPNNDNIYTFIDVLMKKVLFLNRMEALCTTNACMMSILVLIKHSITSQKHYLTHTYIEPFWNHITIPMHLCTSQYNNSNGSIWIDEWKRWKTGKEESKMRRGEIPAEFLHTRRKVWAKEERIAGTAGSQDVDKPAIGALEVPDGRSLSCRTSLNIANHFLGCDVHLRWTAWMDEVGSTYLYLEIAFQTVCTSMDPVNFSSSQGFPDAGSNGSRHDRGKLGFVSVE